MVPVPVPVYIPVPMNMFPQQTPVLLPVPMPVPVPLVVPLQNKEMKDAAVQSDLHGVKEETKKDNVSSTDQSGSTSGDMKFKGVVPTICEDEKTVKAVQADMPPAVSAGTSVESTDDQLNAQPETSQTVSNPSPTSARDQPPSSPFMDLESGFPSESLDQTSAPQRGLKRPRGGSSSRKRGRRRTGSLERSEVAPPPAAKLNHLYGVKAWMSWVHQRNKQLHESDPVEIKEDILQCHSAELNFALSRFIREVRRPNGESYSPDSILYLCLGIQQYLFMKGRIENIFTDELYRTFATEITVMLRLWKPKLLPSGCPVPSRVEESYLWECKQLGAYSPIVLLNTLLFFCTKNLRFTTLAQHQGLSFANLARCSRPSSRTGKIHYLQYQRCSAGSADTEQFKKKQAENQRDLEILENVINPLRCPVQLYQFYLSRCPESAKKRNDVFYLQPHQNVHTNSCHWFIPQPLDSTTLQSMLTRILAVREVQQETDVTRHQASATMEGYSLQ